MRHHWFSVLSAISVVRFAGLATPLASHWDDMHVKHAWKAAPSNWESLGPPHPGTTIDLQIALKPDNENALIDKLYEVSTPSNPKYGAHLSKEEVAELVAPNADTLEFVHSWLAYHGVQSSSILTTHGGGWLRVSGILVSQANELLDASFQLYRYFGTNDTAILRTVSYSLPRVLHGLVQAVVPTTFFASARTLQQAPQRYPIETPAKVAPRAPELRIVKPDFLRWLYKTAVYTPVVPTKNALGIAGYNNEFPSRRDLKLFMSVLRSDAEAATYSVEQVNDGEYDPSDPGPEANLNIQYAEAIAYPTRHIYYSTGGKILWFKENGQSAPGDLFVAWLEYVLAQNDIPQTISTSYAAHENELPPEYATTVCNLFARLGARGVSILFASGDHGVGDGDCKDSSGKVQFKPKFPASCPYVTSVGGTMMSLPEIGAPLSTGGFSNYFPRPPYQKAAVPKFLRSLGNQYKGFYNAAGRGIPDVSAQSVRYMIVLDGSPGFVNGTSAATPVVAGIMSLLNDFLISEGKRPLGFLNPWLYSDAVASLNDIKSGNNPGCNTDGFTARRGWDPVTGLGTPDFFELLHLLLRTRIQGPGNQGRAFSELLNISDTADSTRYNEEIDEYFNSSTGAASPAHGQCEPFRNIKEHLNDDILSEGG